MPNDARRADCGSCGNGSIKAGRGGAVGGITSGTFVEVARVMGPFRKFAISNRDACGAFDGSVVTRSGKTPRRGVAGVSASSPATRAGSAQRAGNTGGMTTVTEDRAGTIPTSGRLADMVAAITRSGTRIGREGSRAHRSVIDRNIACSLAIPSSA